MKRYITEAIEKHPNSQKTLLKAGKKNYHLHAGALPEIRNGGGLFGGSGGKAPSRWRHGGVGAEPPAHENFAFFCKNNFILGLF